jgi:hypothetical protein
MGEHSTAEDSGAGGGDCALEANLDGCTATPSSPFASRSVQVPSSKLQPISPPSECSAGACVLPGTESSPLPQPTHSHVACLLGTFPRAYPKLPSCKSYHRLGLAERAVPRGLCALHTVFMSFGDCRVSRGCAPGALRSWDRARVPVPRTLQGSLVPTREQIGRKPATPTLPHKRPGAAATLTGR